MKQVLCSDWVHEREGYVAHAHYSFPALVQQLKVFFWLYIMSFHKQAWVKRVAYWQTLFLHFNWPRLLLVQQKRKKDTGQYGWQNSQS